MLTTTRATSTRAPAKSIRLPQAVNDGPPPACAALAQLGDAAALIDVRGRSVQWTSPAWLTLLPEIGAGTQLAALERALPGLVAAHWIDMGADAPRRLSVGEAQQWDAQIATFDADRRILRITDRREQGRVLQRQLDDREQLLFTSRVISDRRNGNHPRA